MTEAPPEPKRQPQTMDIDEFAAAAGIARNTAYSAARLAVSGDKAAFPVPVYRIGKRFLIPREPAEKFFRGEL